MKKISIKDKPNVLIVDDDPITLRLFSNILIKMGLNPVLAKNGKEGLKVLEETPDIGFIFTDYKMPIMDGPTMIKKINKNPDKKDIPMVIFSGFLGYKHSGKLLELGVKGFIEKPIHQREIEKILDRFYKLDTKKSPEQKT